MEQFKKLIRSHNCLVKEHKSTQDKLNKLQEDLKALYFNHNNLEGLQGGKSGEFYHLSKEMYDLINSDLKAVVDGFKKFMGADDVADERQLVDIENKLNENLGTW